MSPFVGGCLLSPDDSSLRLMMLPFTRHCLTLPDNASPLPGDASLCQPPLPDAAPFDSRKSLLLPSLWRHVSRSALLFNLQMKRLARRTKFLSMIRKLGNVSFHIFRLQFAKLCLISSFRS
ncbi:unnamed protein product [Victoria cruziana]